MNRVLYKNNKIYNYIDSSSKFALLEFQSNLFDILNNYKHNVKSIIFLCIGSDRATGDSLGPLVGYKLSKLPFKNNIFIYGTLESPVHAKNLKETIEYIYLNHSNHILIAIDASLGNKEHINYISIGEGGIKPGAGVKKDLPYVGDIYIKGIVNKTGLLELSVLQNTRLSMVMNMADIISSGIWHCVNNL